MATDHIMPALTTDEWAKGAAEGGTGYDRWTIHFRVGEVHGGEDSQGEWPTFEGDSIPVLMAAANAALPDDDPRKITSRKVGLLRDVATGLELAEDIPGAHGSGEFLRQFADELAAMLPPER